MIDLLEVHFLGHRAKRVNDEIWDELMYNFVQQKRCSSGLSVEHGRVLSDLLEQISDFTDVRTVPGSDSFIIGKTISAVRNVDIFKVVCQNPPQECTRPQRRATLMRI